VDACRELPGDGLLTAWCEAAVEAEATARDHDGHAVDRRIAAGDPTAIHDAVVEAIGLLEQCRDDLDKQLVPGVGSSLLRLGDVRNGVRTDGAAEERR
jgi:hypothetical protein